MDDEITNALDQSIVQLADVLNEVINQETIEIIEQLGKTMQQLAYETYKAIGKIAKVLHEAIVKLVEYIVEMFSEIERCIQYYEFNELFIFPSITLEQNQDRAPPQESIIVKMQVYYIFFCLFIFPYIAKGIMYCEELIISNYLFDLIKFALAFIGVCL